MWDKAQRRAEICSFPTTTSSTQISILTPCSHAYSPPKLCPTESKCGNYLTAHADVSRPKAGPSELGNVCPPQKAMGGRTPDHTQGAGRHTLTHQQASLKPHVSPRLLVFWYVGSVIKCLQPGLWKALECWGIPSLTVTRKRG